MPPQDVRYTLEVDFLDAVNGGQKRVTMPDGRTLEISIPAGINEGQILRLKGQDCPAPPARRATPTSRFPSGRTPASGGRSDILTTLPVSLGEALNGASVRVDTVDGPVDVKVPKGAKGYEAAVARQGRCPRQGRHAQRSARRDPHRVPEGADDALAEFIAEWEKAHPQNPRRKGAA